MLCRQVIKKLKNKEKYENVCKSVCSGSSLKKNGDTVHVDAWIGLENSKNGNYVGDIRAKYTVMLIKDGKKMRVALWDLAKEKECKPGKTASYKKSGKY